MPVKTY